MKIFMEPQLELEVLVININPGKNEELLALCDELNAYMMYIEKIRKFRKSGNGLTDAVNKAVEECINENILADFFKQHRSEVISMSIFEYDQEKHFRMIAKENQELGFIKAMASLVNDGYSLLQMLLQGQICRKQSFKRSRGFSQHV